MSFVERDYLDDRPSNEDVTDPWTLRHILDSLEERLSTAFEAVEDAAGSAPIVAQLQTQVTELQQLTQELVGRVAALEPEPEVPAEGTNLVWGHAIPLAANDTLFSEPFAAGAGSVVTALSESDQAGTLSIETSANLTSWTLLDSASTVAVEYTAGVTANTDVAWVRFKYANGSVDQGMFQVRGWVDDA